MSKEENFLDRVYARNDKYEWEIDENDQVIILVENTGIFNLIAQKLLKKPRVSKIHLEEMGSFVWKCVDGKKDVHAIGKEVEQHFGEKANPLYERLSVYMKQMEAYGFIFHSR